MTPSCRIAADIGTDHGMLGCELLTSGKCEYVWFTDISKPSLAKARTRAESLGLTDRAAFYLGDGALALPGRPDTAIIAGMGGNTIVHILSCGLSILRGSILVLGANTALFALRKWLCDNAYSITDERAVSEAGRHYVLIRAQSGKSSYTWEELTAGPILINKTDTQTREYFAFRCGCAKTALDGASKSSDADITCLKKEWELWRSLM